MPGFDNFKPYDPPLDMMKLDMAYLAKFGSIEVRIGTGPGFLGGRDYVALLNVLQDFRAAIIKENETRTHPMLLHFIWEHFYPDPEDIPRMDEILRFQKLEAVRTTIEWPFEFLEKVNFTRGSSEIEGKWNFEQDANFPEAASGRRFWMNNWEHGFGGFAVIDVVDENEWITGDDEDAIDEDEDMPDSPS